MMPVHTQIRVALDALCTACFTAVVSLEIIRPALKDPRPMFFYIGHQDIVAMVFKDMIGASTFYMAPVIAWVYVQEWKRQAHERNRHQADGR